MVQILIFLAGLLVYAGYGLWGLGCILAAALISWAVGLITPKHPWTAFLAVGLNALWLVLLRLERYTGLALLAPMGVSYFTLQLISYNVDVYRGKYPPEKNAFKFALFVTYLPHLFIGPVESYDRMIPALYENRKFSWDNFSAGAVRVLWGLNKRLIISARLGVITAAISADTAAYSGGYALAAMLLYSVQLYCDFSGGIDMVLGVSRMLGITMSENFRTPYFSQSVQEFWNRWHITLGRWLKEYIYIPLGGNRKGKARKVLNLLITFLVSGLWHGVSYLLWGLGNGILVALGKKAMTRWKLLNRAITFLLISLLWSFFIWPDALTALKMLGSVFTTFNYAGLPAGIAAMGLTLGDWMVLAAACIGLWLADWKQEALAGRFLRLSPALRLAVMGVLGLLALVFGMYGIGFNAQAFIYSSF